MALVRQPKTAGFSLISRYDIFADWPSSCYGPRSHLVTCVVSAINP